MITFLTTLIAMSLSFPATDPDVPWREVLKKQLPLLGHRNWIVIADSAYPWQTSPGVETVVTGASQAEVVRATMEALRHVNHVRPVIMTDAELPFVPEKESPGVDRYRAELANIFKGQPVHSMLHEQIIGKLDEAGKTFHVLLLKTTMTIPYTSVFLELRAGYWGDENETRLRESMQKGH